MYEDRILAPQLREKVMSAEEAAELIKSGMVLGYSGFAMGFPKAVPLAIYAKGEARDLTVLCGAAPTSEVFAQTGASGCVSRFYGFQFVKETREAIAKGKMQFGDVHLGQFADKIRKGYYGKVDYAIIECMQINEDGGLVPTLSAGIVNALVQCAEKVIVEVNEAVPLELVGIHDFGDDPSVTLTGMTDRMGEHFLPCPFEKIAAIVMTDIDDKHGAFRGTNELYSSMAHNVVSCLRHDIETGRLPENFTLQVGTGGVANAVLLGLKEGGFTNLNMFTEVLTDSALDFIENGVFNNVTTTCLDVSAEALKNVVKNPAFYKEKIIIRPLDVTNSPRRIGDMGLVAMNTAVEADIYGNVNSTHVMGVSMLNGIGGSNDFSRSAHLSVFITPSTAKDGAISSIVPMVTHVDSSEHDTDIIVTEYGYADLRGLTPKERAKAIIDNCAHPDYRPQLHKYFDEAVALCGPCQTPHNLAEAFSWHLRYLQTGSMREQ